MKKLIILLAILLVSIDAAFAAWLGWEKDDSQGKGYVMVFKNDSLGNNASSPEDLMKMSEYGDVILVVYGTRCYVLEQTMSKAKVRITSGTHEGYVGWIYIETLRE